MSAWTRRFGSWWMIEGMIDGWINFPPGIHWDFKRRFRSDNGKPYGPYVSIHVLFWIVYIGFHPARSLDGWFE